MRTTLWSMPLTKRERNSRVNAAGAPGRNDRRQHRDEQHPGQRSRKQPVEQDGSVGFPRAGQVHAGVPLVSAIMRVS